MCRLSLFFVLTIFSSLASAVDYYWYDTLFPDVHYQTPNAACQVKVNREFPGRTFVVDIQNPTTNSVSALCRTYWNGSYYGAVSVSRGGNGCSGTYDVPTAICTPAPSCADKAGTSRPFSKSGSAGDNYMTLTTGPKPVAIAAQAGCFDGCMASTADQKCTTKTSGSYFCRGTAWFDGQSCASTGTPGVDSSSTSQYPDAQQTTDKKPCNYTTNADGTQSCTSSNGTENEGQICGTVSATGQRICVDKPPSKQGLDISTTVKTETDANGNKTTTKTDTATTTKCSDIKACVSTSTTVTTVVKGDGSVSSTCKGANCPDKNTNPDGNGDGFGDCVSGECGEGQGGDAGGLGLPELEDVPGFGDSTQQFVDRVSGSQIANAMGNVRAPGGACPIFQGEAGFLGHLTIDGHCSVIAGNESLIRLAAKTVWALLACWILLG
ncbi:hypothetical protein AADS62_004713 [Escherichia coli]